LALIRLLDFALLTFLVWLVWSQLIRGWRSASTPPANAADGADPRRQAPRPPAAGAAGTASEQPLLTLVRCSACGVHVPSARILPGAAGEVFCSDACRGRGAARPPA
jgi:hypothetical protein